MIEFFVSDNESGERLDVVATRHINVSRAFIKKLSEDNRITVNDNSEKAGHKLRPGDKVKINYDHEELKPIPPINLPILYEDDDCIVINKPVGVLTHSKGAFNPEATVTTWLKNHLKAGNKKKEKRKKGTSDVQQPLIPYSLFLISNSREGIVHRLDRATSGVMICAKNPAVLSWLQKQFSNRKVKKSYVAIIAGQLEPAHAIIDMPIERNPKAPATFRVGSNGKPAVTEYIVEQTGPKYSLLKLMPTTGRTHQLRVHLKHSGHPIVGDVIYGGIPADRLYLHANTLEITLPNRERKTFTAPVPEEFKIKLNEQ